MVKRVYVCVSCSSFCLFVYRLYNSSNCIITVCAYIQQGSCIFIYASTRVDRCILRSRGSLQCLLSANDVDVCISFFCIFSLFCVVAKQDITRATWSP